MRIIRALFQNLRNISDSYMKLCILLLKHSIQHIDFATIERNTGKPVKTDPGVYNGSLF